MAKLGPSEPALQSLIQLLADWGIDAREVQASDYDERGYYTLVRNPNGTYRQSITGELYREFHEWPEGFPYDDLIKLHQLAMGY